MLDFADCKAENFTGFSSLDTGKTSSKFSKHMLI